LSVSAVPAVAGVRLAEALRPYEVSIVSTFAIGSRVGISELV